TAAVAAPASRPGVEPDLAYGAYQRGYFLNAFAEATKRVDQKSDPRSMTLLGELYSGGIGIPQDDAKAVEWYRPAAGRGDRDAMFALALFNMTGRGGLRDRAEAARLFAEAAKLGHPAAAYDLGLLYLEGQQFPQDFGRAAELFRSASQAGSPEAQYALATLYKDGRGVEKNETEAARLLAAAALAENPDAEARGALAAGGGAARREPGRRGGIRHRPVQRHRRHQGRGPGDRVVPPVRPARQPDRPEPPGAHLHHRPRCRRQSGRGDQMAP